MPALSPPPNPHPRLDPPPSNLRLSAVPVATAQRMGRSSSPSSSSITSQSSTSSVDVEHATPRLSSRLARPGTSRHSAAASAASGTTRQPYIPPTSASSSSSNSPTGPSSNILPQGRSSASWRRQQQTEAAIPASGGGLNLLSGDEIEMDQLRTTNTHSHRRRRSSLMNDVLPGHSGSNGRNRGNSIRHGSPPKSKISEEADEDGFVETTTPKREDSDDGLSDFSDADLNDDEETGLTKRERSKRRKRRLRNAQLDQRIARGERISPDEKKEADTTVVRRLVVNGGLIGLWYLFSLSISLYNKWMFDNAKLNFPFPLFTTALHMLVQFSLASLVLYFLPHLRPGYGGAHGRGHASDRGRSRHESEPTDKSPMTRWFYWTRIGPCGAATGLDIGLGNASLKFITLTFYTMCKSSALAFVLLFAFFFRLETPTWRLVAIIAVMTLGVVMMVAGEVEFNLAGFLLVISAAFFSGFRWGLTQILLLRNPATSNPFSSIFYLAPIMFLTLTLIALPSEGIREMFHAVGDLAETHGKLVAPMILLFPGTIAFAMTASEFALLQRTSVVTLSIAGIFKEVVTISAAAMVYDDSLTPINLSGLMVTIGAICAYNWMKIKNMREEAQKEVHRDHILSNNDEDEELSSPPLWGGAGESSGSGSGSGSGSDGDDADEERQGLVLAHAAPRPADSMVTSEGDILLTRSVGDIGGRA
ncbi:TPT-domain-containing protein [Zalerion maritima]|uniref:TPT-domain-containing protein n=1 Tax=Zalerion maritima TaxID=339359 RepID=A0AAD5WV74_9PEZI|nr:TPT-domain-containing protein [Zalerion maritima]